MAIVYKAYDRVEDRIVSIKILRDEYLGNQEFLRRFRNESRAIAMLSHPNIVKVYDVSFGDRLQYIVMEYIDGITLKEYISQQHIIRWKEAVHFTLQILYALQHVTLPREKDDTDTMAAVKIGLERGFRRFLLLNCTGGRLDHTFANLTVLMYLQQHGATGLLRDGNCTAQVCGEGHIPLKQRKGDGLSLFPFGCPEVTVSGEGVFYPLRSLRLRADFPHGVSNEIVADSAWVEVEQGTVLMICEKK